MFLKNTYVYNVDVSPPVGSALEVALITFAKNLETSLIFIIWNIESKEAMELVYHWVLVHRVHAAWDSQ